MTARRHVPRLLEGKALDASLRSAGLRLGHGQEVLDPPVSPELVIASAVAAAIPDDLRLLSVVTTWLGVHSPRLHVGELVRLLPHAERACADRDRFRAYWAGVAHWLRSDSRWGKVAHMYAGSDVYLSSVGDEVARLALVRKGEDPRFTGSRLRVPSGMLRDRIADVSSPERLAANHPWYRERLRQGPTYRADCWAELERAPEMSAAELSRRVGCTYPVAHKAVQDMKVALAAGVAALRTTIASPRFPVAFASSRKCRAKAR
jgi:hypothetical protein